MQKIRIIYPDLGNRSHIKLVDINFDPQQVREKIVKTPTQPQQDLSRKCSAWKDFRF